LTENDKNAPMKREGVQRMRQGRPENFKKKMRGEERRMRYVKDTWLRREYLGNSWIKAFSLSYSASLKTI
jgi:hypothetical protein